MSTMGLDDIGRLMREQASVLALYARQWCSAPEDVVQEAFVKLAASGIVPDNPQAWLFKAVRHGALTARRASQRRRRHESAAAQLQAPWFCQRDDGPVDADAAQRALESLPADQREVITLHLWGGLTFAQVADVAGCSASTAHRWYLEGLARLRERLHVPCPTVNSKKN
jgi:RNA polymerase sigma factor (sigma-70 family)